MMLFNDDVKYRMFRRDEREKSVFDNHVKHNSSFIYPVQDLLLK